MRCAQMAIDQHPAIHDPSVQVRTDQPGHPCVIDAFLESVDQDVVIAPIKELGQIHVHHHALARLDVRPCGLDRIVRAPARPKPVAVLAEGGVDQRLQHLQKGLLDQSICHRRNGQLLCRPCIRVFMQRTSGFVAGSVWPGFTVPPSCPPGSLRHLTHDLVALHVLGYSLSFGPSLLPCGLSGPGSNCYDLC